MKDIFREWYVNPNNPEDRVTYSINDSSHINSNHLCYSKFVARVIAKPVRHQVCSTTIWKITNLFTPLAGYGK